MKRITLIALLLLTGTVFTNAQKFHFGLTVAPSLAWIKPDTKGLDNNGVKLGFSYGIMTEFAFNKNENYALATGLEVAYRGGKTSKLVDLKDANGTIIKTVNSKTKYTLEYLELPVTIKMKTNEIGAFKYFGQFGLVPAVNIKATGANELDGITTSGSIKSDINSFNASLLIALGLEYNLLGNTSMVVSVGFNNGLTDVLNDKNAKAISNSVSLNVGVLF